MRSRTEIFKENKVLGGYSIAVRDDWSFKIKRLHISHTEKEAYEREFGETLLLEKDFMIWWLDLREKNQPK
ncbi:MAG: hypothetical protein U0W24_18455 [Bacteroidales bacterium]